MNPKDQKEAHPEHDRAEMVYFLPNEVILHLKHSKHLSPEDLAGELSNFLTSKDPSHPWKHDLHSPGAESFITFQFNGEDKATSLVPTLARRGVTGLLKDMHVQSHGEAVDLSRTGRPSLTLVSASPHWLVGGVSHGIGVASPGAWPEEARLAGDRWPQFKLADGQPGAAEFETKTTEGAGVQVAILDSVPCVSELAAAYEKWRKQADGHPQPGVSGPNLLINSLLCPGGRLQVHPASFEDLRSVAAYNSSGHPYPMADHGIFVAGIIHTLAPQASLHLYEVLNPFGVGCVKTIMKALAQILETARNGGPTIVNCSLVLNLPLDGHSDPDYPSEFLEDGLHTYMLTPYREIFDSLSKEGLVVVAAAGNDAQDDVQPPARCPAAFESVIGVAAMPRDASSNPVNKASYSNKAAVPPERGYVTLGGEGGVEKGILGAFISLLPKYMDRFPPDKRQVRRERVRYRYNKSGWAWWAGTSFAAPVITGILARSWNGATPASLDGAITILTSMAGTNKTHQKEKVIFMNQERR